MRNPLTVLRFARAYISLLRDPSQLDRVFALADSIGSTDLFEVMPWLRGRPEIEALVSRPSTRLRFDRATLKGLPPGTLGHAYLALVEHSGIDPNDLDHAKGQSTLDRFRAHLESTHDLWHVITGFGTNVDGEIGLQAFYFGQLSAPLPLVLLSAGLLNSAIIDRGSGSARVEHLVRGWLMGKRAEPITGLDWAACWDRPLGELRRELRIELDPLDGGGALSPAA